MAITLTEAAAEHILKTLAERGKGLGLRLGTRAQGCTGYSYVIEIADEIQDTDQVFEQYGAKILVDPISLPILDGTQLDFVTKGLNRTFEFNNPKAEHYCGCGESFSIKSEETTTETHKNGD